MEAKKFREEDGNQTCKSQFYLSMMTFLFEK